MRILILHSRYRTGPASGENRVVDDETELLRRNGHDVDLFVPEIGTPGIRELASVAMGTIWSRRSVAEVGRRIDRWKPDLIHCHNLFPALSPAVIRAARDVPVVVTLHNYRFMCLPSTLYRDGHVCEDCLGRAPWPGVVHRCYQGTSSASAVLATSLVLHRMIDTFRHVDRYIAISDFVLRKHVEAGFPAGCLTVKRHFALPVETAREGPGEHFVFLGRLVPEKGLETLIQAWPGITHPLIVLGDGPEAARLRDVAPPNVSFRGTVEPQEVTAVLRDARAVLVPSRWHEAAGRVVVEAYAAGLPVVVASAGALPEIVEDGINGFVVPPRDARAWRSAVMRLGDDSEAQRLGSAAAQTWADRYTPAHGLRDLEHIYRSVLR